MGFCMTKRTNGAGITVVAWILANGCFHTWAQQPDAARSDMHVTMSKEELAKAQHLHLQAFTVITRGDRALERKQWDEAAKRYQQAVGFYDKMVEQFPAWKPNTVQQRMAYCRNQLRYIEQNAQGEGASQVAQAPDEAGTGAAAAELDLDVGVQQPDANLGEERIQKLQQQNDALSHEIQILKNQQNWHEDLARSNTILRKRIKTLEQQLQQQAPSRIAALEKQLAELQKEYNNLRSVRGAMDSLEQLQDDHDRLSGKLKDYLQREDAWLDDKAALGKKIQDQQAELEDLRDRLTGKVKSDSKVSEKKLHAIQERNDHLVRQLEKLNKQAQKLRAIVAEQDKREDRLRNAWKNKSQMEKDLAYFKSRAEELTLAAEELGQSIDTLTNEKKELTERCDTLAAKLENKFEEEKAAGRLNPLVMKEEIAKLQSDNMRLRDLASALDEELMKTKQNRKDDFNNPAKSQKSRASTLQYIEQLEVERMRLLGEIERLRRQPPSATGRSVAQTERSVATYPASPEPPAASPAPVKSGGKAVENMVTAGNNLLQEGSIFNAKRFFLKALEEDSRHVDARLGLVTCHYMQNELDQAARLIQELLVEAPDQSAILGMQGLIAWRQGQLDVAEDALEKALLQDPQSAKLHNYMGVVMHERNQLDKALREFEIAVKLNPKLADAYYNLALLLAMDKNMHLEKAKDYYKKAINLGRAPDHELEEILFR